MLTIVYLIITNKYREIYQINLNVFGTVRSAKRKIYDVRLLPRTPQPLQFLVHHSKRVEMSEYAEIVKRWQRLPNKSILVVQKTGGQVRCLDGRADLWLTRGSDTAR